ncbi:hypothetical protein [Streptomyces sp. NBC_00859]|uniref:hypothetical protein n=1 Tax=Streptomyces sp. NBC_00859 TaxID=2903682 RepID=UPI00386AEDE4|nr:hypothetical protein OG584_17990 [Streptomyces sp. NBC_00859]
MRRTVQLAVSKTSLENAQLTLLQDTQGVLRLPDGRVADMADSVDLALLGPAGELSVGGDQRYVADLKITAVKRSGYTGIAHARPVSCV